MISFFLGCLFLQLEQQLAHTHTRAHHTGMSSSCPTWDEEEQGYSVNLPSFCVPPINSLYLSGMKELPLKTTTKDLIERMLPLEYGSDNDSCCSQEDRDFLATRLVLSKDDSRLLLRVKDPWISVSTVAPPDGCAAAGEEEGGEMVVEHLVQRVFCYTPRKTTGITGMMMMKKPSRTTTMGGIQLCGFSSGWEDGMRIAKVLETGCDLPTLSDPLEDIDWVVDGVRGLVKGILLSSSSGEQEKISGWLLGCSVTDEFDRKTWTAKKRCCRPLFLMQLHRTHRLCNPERHLHGRICCNGSISFVSYVFELLWPLDEKAALEVLNHSRDEECWVQKHFCHTVPALSKKGLLLLPKDIQELLFEIGQDYHRKKDTEMPAALTSSLRSIVLDWHVSRSRLAFAMVAAKKHGLPDDMMKAIWAESGMDDVVKRQLSGRSYFLM